jgi:hypothetical protein
VSIHPYTSISENSEQILIQFDTRVLHEKLLREFNFGSYWSNGARVAQSV